MGLVGGVASGKSTVADLFRDRGCMVVDADALAHEVLARPDVRDRVVARFGAEMLDGSGSIDRDALGRRVFGDASALEALGAMVHPEVRGLIYQRLEAVREDSEAVVVLDVPLLLESPYAGICDHVVFVNASEATRVGRAGSRGWSAQDLALREGHQAPLAGKRLRATFVLANDGGIEETRREVQRFFREALGRQTGPSPSGGNK